MISRGFEALLQLRAAVNDAGGALETPSIEFGDDSDSVPVENLLASILKDVLEGFASNRFSSMAEVKKVFDANPECRDLPHFSGPLVDRVCSSFVCHHSAA
ncbi:MAG: hypothetical protein AAF183_16730 [Pseudomonadota bacterium]